MTSSLEKSTNVGESYRTQRRGDTIDLTKCRLRKRDDSPESPKRLLDCVAAYKRY
jgi:hypothetical protein